MTSTQLPESLLRRRSERAGGDGKDARRSAGRTDWTSWPAYDAAATGLRDYWYPVAWSTQVGRQAGRRATCAASGIVLQRDEHGTAWAPARPLPAPRRAAVAWARRSSPARSRCPYHAWTYRLSDGELVRGDHRRARLADVRQGLASSTYPVDEALGLVWVFVGDGEPHPLDDAAPRGARRRAADGASAGASRTATATGGYYAENGFDEGHAKYLHRTSYWRIFKTMPTWNKVHIERHGRWIYRVEDERHWDADFPGLGHWTNERWWKIKPKVQQGASLGNTGQSTRSPTPTSPPRTSRPSPRWPCPACCASPTRVHPLRVLRADRRRAHQVRRRDGQVRVGARRGLSFFARYLGGIRWLFHGNFSGQDHWMVADDRRPARAPLPPRRLAARVAPPRRGGPSRSGRHPAHDRRRTGVAAALRHRCPRPRDGRSTAAAHDYHVITLGDERPRQLAGDLFLHGGGPGCSAWTDFGPVAPLFAADRPLPPRRPAAVRQVGQDGDHGTAMELPGRRRWSALLDDLGDGARRPRVQLVGRHDRHRHGRRVPRPRPLARRHRLDARVLRPARAAARGRPPRPHRPRRVLRRRRPDARQDAPT